MTDVDDDDLAVPDRFTSLEAALNESLRSTPHLPRDRAMIELARHYARMLDDAADRLSDAGEGEAEDGRDFARMAALIARIGPRYEATLDRLGMSPGARPAVRGGEHDGRTDPAAAALAVLQSGGVAAGVDYAAGVDPAVTAADAED
jgi:hypothetical protein